MQEIFSVLETSISRGWRGIAAGINRLYPYDQRPRRSFETPKEQL